MFPGYTLAGIIRIHSDPLAGSQAERTFAELFDAWGRRESASASQSGGVVNRLAGTLSGPRQHKLQANLQRLQAELAHELAGFLGSAESE